VTIRSHVIEASGSSEAWYVRLASSLAAALLNGLFEHPAGCTPIFPDVQTGETPVYPQDLTAAC
jgi:hypothetical protein